MKKKLSLPFYIFEDFCGYPFEMLPYSILKANDGDFSKTSAELFINPCFKIEDSKPMFVTSIFDNWFTQRQILGYEYAVLSKELLSVLKTSLPTLFKKYLQSGSYPYCYLWLSGNVNVYDYAVFGFDDIKKVFLVSYIDGNGSQKCAEMGYAQFEEKIFSVNGTSMIYFWRYNQSRNSVPNLNSMANDLKDYLNSVTSKPLLTEGYNYGINGIAMLKNHIQGLKDGTDCQRLLHGFCIHKYFMHERVKYLAVQGTVDAKYAEISGSVFENAKKAAQSASITDICKLIEQTIDAEKEYLPLILKSIECASAE